MISLVLTGIVLVFVALLTRDRIRVHYEYYSDKKIKSKSEYVKIGGNMIKNGATICYYENGTKKAEFEYKNDMLDGIQVYYDEHGKVIKKEIYSNGSLFQTIT